MSCLQEMKLKLNTQIITIKKDTKTEVSCEFTSLNRSDMIILFFLGCKCQGISVEEALATREIMLPTLNWKCKNMLISNLDRYSTDHPFAYFHLVLPKEFMITTVKVYLTELLKNQPSLPPHDNGYVVYKDGSYKWDADISTKIAIGDTAFSITCPFDKLEEIINERL